MRSEKTLQSKPCGWPPAATCRTAAESEVGVRRRTHSPAVATAPDASASIRVVLPHRARPSPIVTAGHVSRSCQPESTAVRQPEAPVGQPQNQKWAYAAARVHQPSPPHPVPRYPSG